MAVVPHFRIRTVTGDAVEYAPLWQRRQLVLIALPRAESDAAASYTRHVHDALASAPKDTALVITRDEIPGIPAPAAVIADRWGEIIHAVHAGRVGDLPPAGELLDWIEHLRQRCPECEGEAR